ncbi:CHAT domain-containing protein [Citricoccus sp. CH26A]|uniref:CHAT domain-containing protein n=1 Tax=Citricoccus TaxID=169133 RepID=UPI0002E09631|nr:CHAT domain-containing protein [Citricoccus sp. CH26A]
MHPDNEQAALIALADLQQRMIAAGIDAMAAPAARHLSSTYRELALEWLERLEMYKRAWPGWFNLDASSVAQPLVQHLSMHADWVEAQGDRTSATALRAEADQLAEKYLSGVPAARLALTRAKEAAAAGRFHDAIVGLQRAKEMFVSASHPIEAAQTVSDLANVYEWLGDFSRALNTWGEAQLLVDDRLALGVPSKAQVAEAIRRQLERIAAGEPVGDASGEDALALRRLHYEAVQGRARVNLKLGHPEMARPQFEEARQYVDEFAPGAIDFYLAATALEVGDLDKATRLLNTVSLHFESGLMRPRRGTLRRLQADVAHQRGTYAEALNLASDGLADQEAYPDLDTAWKLHWRKGRALAAMGRQDEALSAYRQAAADADTLRLAPLGYQLDTCFIRDKLPMLHEAIDLALAMKADVVTMELVEYLKARALAAVLSTPPQPADHDTEQSRFDQLSLAIDAVNFADYAGIAQVEDLRHREELLKQRRALLEEIRLKDPRWRGLRVPAPPDIESIHHQLAASRRLALILHLRGDRLIAGLLGGPEGVVVDERTWDDNTHQAVRQYAANLTRVNPDHTIYDLSEQGGVDLVDLLPASISRALTGALSSASVVLVVPHDVLHLLPWAALKMKGRRLFDSAAVGLLPNLAALAIEDGSVLSSPQVALIGDPDYTGLEETYSPLPEAAAELSDLEALYGPERLIMPPARGKHATEAACLELLRRPEGENAILHVACHADIDEEEPLASALILSNSTLDAGEIIQRRCPYPEVVLSACSTGWRPQTAHEMTLAGDDALGLVASFLEAGARSLLVSVTKANDQESRRFTTTWHRYRRSGRKPLEAFRATQQQLEGGPVYLWAGMTLYGSR